MLLALDFGKIEESQKVNGCGAIKCTDWIGW